MANLILMLTLRGTVVPERIVFLTLALLTTMVTPLRPRLGSIGYLIVWIALGCAPVAETGDLAITDAVSAFLMGRFLPLRLAVPLALTPPIITLIGTGDGAYFASMLFNVAIALPAGLLVRVTVNSWRSEVSAVSGQLEAIRNEVAREMHDLVAYSMSQTAYGPSWPPARSSPPTLLARSSPPSRPPPLTRSTSSASFCAPCAATTATTTAPRADWAR